MSNHKWYTLSGIASRLFAFLAVQWSKSPGDMFPVAVFAFGMIELFGLRRSAKIVRRIREKETRKLRKRTNLHVADNPTASTRGAGPIA